MPRLKTYLTTDGLGEFLKRAIELDKNDEKARFLGISVRAYQNLVSGKADQSSISPPVRRKLLTFFSHDDYRNFTADRKRCEAENDVKHVAHTAETTVGFTPATAAHQPPAQDRASAQKLNRELVDDPLTGVGLAEALGNDEDREQALRNANKWLKESPNDICIRATVVWSTYVLGNPSNMAQVLKDTARWLIVPTSDGDPVHSEAWGTKLNEKLDQLKKGTVEHPSFARRHLEDTLVRATLLRYLRLHGQSSQLMREFKSIAPEFENRYALRSLLDSTKSRRGNSWTTGAIELVRIWANIEQKNGLARLCLLWFTGRQGQKNQIQIAIEESCRWLERYPDHTLVRWATIWLAGLDPEGKPNDGLIEEWAKWLETGAPDDERLVRHGFLWLVGVSGNPEQVQQAIRQTARWLRAHRDDDFIRVPFLLFLVMRRGTSRQRKKAIAETRTRLRDHPDDDEYGLTELAVRLCESDPDA